jgi:hypothetical protein
MLVASILFLAILTPIISSKSNIESSSNEEKKTKNRIGFVRILNNILGRILSNRPKLLPSGIFDSNIHTSCDGVEKDTTIMLWSASEIDVDDDPGTGNENGADVKVQYNIYPWFEISTDIGFGLIFSLKITRLGEEIKESDFSISLEVGGNTLKLGYWSPSETGNAIPDETTVSLKIFFYIFQRTRGFNLNIEPIYSDGNENKKIELYSELNIDTIQQRSSIGFDPAIVTDVSFVSTKRLGVWTYDFHRESSQQSEVTTTFTTTDSGLTRETILTIDKLPKDLEFSLGITPIAAGGGSFLYESSEMYDIELKIIGNNLINSLYSLLRNTPRRMYAEWIPTFDNGEYHLDIESDGTDFIIRDTEVNPFVNLEVKGIETVDLDAYWNFTNPGTFTVYKNNELNVGLDFSIGTWIAQLNAQPTANFVEATWLIDNSGYLTIDTNWEPISTLDLLIKGPSVGLHTIGESFKAEDFEIDWTLWPPQEFDLTINGLVDFISVSIDLYLIDTWYHLWPW